MGRGDKFVRILQFYVCFIIVVRTVRNIFILLARHYTKDEIGNWIFFKARHTSMR